jgi:hypothetical protein
MHKPQAEFHPRTQNAVFPLDTTSTIPQEVVAASSATLRNNKHTAVIIMPKQAAPQDKDDEASFDSSVASLDMDLQALNEMDIDADFNMWSSFRNSFSVEKRATLQEIGNSQRSSGGSTAAAVLMGSKNEKFDGSLHSSLNSIIEEVDLNEDPLHQLSPEEQKDIHQWNARLAREQVFSRYYFPEQWELRELSTIQKFLKLENPNTAHGFTVSISIVVFNIYLN